MTTTTTVRTVVNAALRRLGALASGDDPGAQEIADALIAYNNMCKRMHGTIIGTKLTPVAMTAATTAEPGGVYMVAFASAGATLTMPSNPKGGSRVGYADTKANFGTYNLTIAPNSRLIAGASTNVTVSTNSANGVYWFNPETGNWVLEGDATIDATVAYPDSLVGYLPDMLAVQIVSEYGGEIRQDIVSMAGEGRQAFARVLGRRGRNQMDAPVGVQIAELARA